MAVLRAQTASRTKLQREGPLGRTPETSSTKQTKATLTLRRSRRARENGPSSSSGDKSIAYFPAGESVCPRGPRGRA